MKSYNRQGLQNFKEYEKKGLIKVELVQPESTPVEITTSGLQRIYPYRQMSVVELGSSMR
jgi:hypothetical protein